MNRGQARPSGLPGWGDSLMNGLPSTSRKKCKPLAGKRCRSQLRKEVRDL